MNMRPISFEAYVEYRARGMSTDYRITRYGFDEWIEVDEKPDTYIGDPFGLRWYHNGQSHVLERSVSRDRLIALAAKYRAMLAMVQDTKWLFDGNTGEYSSDPYIGFIKLYGYTYTATHTNPDTNTERRFPSVLKAQAWLSYMRMELKSPNRYDMLGVGGRG